MSKFLFTSESVTEGHPDKVCDKISDAILDYIISNDKNARVACETTVTTGLIHIMGEITTCCKFDADKIARETVKKIGYDDPSCGFDYKSCAVISTIHSQSPDIAMGVDKQSELSSQNTSEYDLTGAGDQGMMFGFACNETPELMPLPILLAHKLVFKLTKLRKDNVLEYLKPDGKSQITIEYDNDIPVRIDTVVISTQHSEDVSLDQIKADITKYVINDVLPDELMDEKTKIFINPTGRFVVGGPTGDSGLTGRKIIVDTYGGYAPHGGGAFSGKDPTKVDRSGAYMARYIAKNIVAAKLARKCEVQIAYAIGVAKPVSVLVKTFGTSDFSDELLAAAVKQVFDLRPAKIIEDLDLKNPIYENLAAYGHIGREDLAVKWEDTDKTADLINAVENLSVNA
ncbi:MAG: methionine adenosyltransferase [Clostridia bacterium]|nr:methionine adenosyltransferase [Clostridia bacterium]